MARKRAFNFYNSTGPRAPRGLPLTPKEVERLLGRLEQHTSDQLGAMAGIHGATLLHAAHGRPVTHETARKILNMLDKFDEEEAQHAYWATRNLDMAEKILRMGTEWNEENLGVVDGLVEAAETRSAKANTAAFASRIATLRQQIDGLRQ